MAQSPRPAPRRRGFKDSALQQRRIAYVRAVRTALNAAGVRDPPLRRDIDREIRAHAKRVHGPLTSADRYTLTTLRETEQSFNKILHIAMQRLPQKELIVFLEHLQTEIAKTDTR